MDSSLLAKIHMVSVMIFLLIYVVKTVLLFSNKAKLDSFARMIKVPEMIISTLFLVTGSWLFILLGGIKVFHLIKLAFVVISIPLAIVAFKRYNKGLALLSLLLIIGSYGLGEMSKNKPFIPAKVLVSNGDGSQLVTGTRVFAANCAFCHGTDGKKAYRAATDLTLSTKDAGSIQQMIREGSKGKMPAYLNYLTPEEIAAVGVYVQTLRSNTALSE
ncbi:MAG TPA: cytochrome c [Bacteroidia bacterium]|nr:cytochrome c [Bacteroidia bacterium]